MEAQIELNEEAANVDARKERKSTVPKVSALQSAQSSQFQKAAAESAAKDKEGKQNPQNTLPPRAAEGTGKSTQSHFLQIQNVTREKFDEISADILIQVSIRVSVYNLDTASMCMSCTDSVFRHLSVAPREK